MSAFSNSRFSIYPKHDLSTLFLFRTRNTGLCGWNIINTNAAVVYIQLFNAAGTGDVTLGTTAPTLVLAIPAGVGASVFSMLSNDSSISFPLGLVAAATTTPTGSTAPGAAMVTEFFID